MLSATIFICQWLESVFFSNDHLKQTMQQKGYISCIILGDMIHKGGSYHASLVISIKILADFDEKLNPEAIFSVKEQIIKKKI